MLKTINLRTNLKTKNKYLLPFLIGHQFSTSTIMIIVFDDFKNFLVIVGVIIS